MTKVSPRISKLNIKNFRSIKGDVTVDLNAPIVLIHGANGMGKTSILSAIEVALTGKINFLNKADADYLRHIPNHGSLTSELSLTVEHSEFKQGKVKISDGKISGEWILNEAEAKIFNERSYLAQSTLSRLIEIYQFKDKSNKESALTSFVNELLELDRLDAVINGLAKTADVRSLRNILPALGESERKLELLRGSEIEQTKNIEKTKADLLRIQIGLSDVLEVPISSIDIETLVKKYSSNKEEKELLSISNLKRELLSLESEWKLLHASSLNSSQSALVKREAELVEQIAFWNDKMAPQLVEILMSIQDEFPNIPASKANPHKSCSDAIKVVDSELSRIKNVIVVHEKSTQKIAELNESISKGASRILKIDAEIELYASSAGEKASALAQILPLIKDDSCPVCQRDYSEISENSLFEDFSRTINELKTGAGKLAALMKDKTDTSRSLSTAKNQISLYLNDCLSEEKLNNLKFNLARFTEVLIKLRSLLEPTSVIVEVMNELSRIVISKEDMLRENSRKESLSKEIILFMNKYRKPQLGDEDEAYYIQRVKIEVTKQESELLHIQNTRNEIALKIIQIKNLNDKIIEYQTLLNEIKEKISSVEKAMKKFHNARALAKNISTKAQTAKNDIVSRVFNESLNRTWKELFIRLAPDEPFVPAFAVPKKIKGPVEAVLQTINRKSGSTSGNPTAMLSAGNLNTAALTLFLALHFSLETKMPWLIIDDPVQSMDEIHISQFAALIRTISKHHHRQIILAVHDRHLFEYLALELSPAFDNDRLITLELGKNADDTTRIDYNPLVWEGDILLN